MVRGDERLALLSEQPEHPLLRRHQRIQPRRLAIKVVGDSTLLREPGNPYANVTADEVLWDALLPRKSPCHDFLSRIGTLIAFLEKPSRAFSLPMCRNLAEPRDAGVSEWCAWVEATGDGAGDERLALLSEQPEHPLLRRHQRIQPRRLAIKVVGDSTLLREPGNPYANVADEVLWDALLPRNPCHARRTKLSQAWINSDVV